MVSGLSSAFRIYFDNGGTAIFTAAESEAYIEPQAAAWHQSMLDAGFAYDGGGTGAWDALEGKSSSTSGVPASTQAMQRTYHLDDSLAGTAPIFIRGVPFGIGDYQSGQWYTHFYRNLSIATHVGTGSPSSTVALENEDPTLCPANYFFTSPAAVTLSTPDHRYAYTGGEGYAAITLPYLDATHYPHNQGTFLLERTTDQDGNPTGDGFAILRLTRDWQKYALNTNVDIHVFNYAAQAWSYMSNQYCWVPVESSHNPGEHVNAYALNYLCGDRWYRMRNFVAVHFSEVAWGDVFQVDTGTGPADFISPRQRLAALPTGGSTVAGTPVAGDVVLAMRWTP